MSIAEVSHHILDYWFSSLDDTTPLARESEPFATCMARWYGKRSDIDADIRAGFEPTLLATTRDGAHWSEQVAEWQSQPQGLLALVILLDQLPRNMYRDSPRMYAYDDLALSVTTLAIEHYAAYPLPLVRRMFLYVPLMHTENPTLQQAMVAKFEGLVALAAERSPHNVAFFESALDSARRHRQVIVDFGRFPHRNELLGRISSGPELEFLKLEGSRF